MAQVTYASKVAVTQANKRIAYEYLVTLINHLPAFGVDLLSVQVNADKTISITLTGPLPDDQREHLGVV